MMARLHNRPNYGNVQCHAAVYVTSLSTDQLQPSSQIFYVFVHIVPCGSKSTTITSYITKVTVSTENSSEATSTMIQLWL